MKILDMMKAEEQKSNISERMADLFYVQQSSRIRFLVDFQDGIGIQWHKDFNNSVDHPCYKQFGKECVFCQSDERKTSKKTPVYMWPIYDYDRAKVQIFYGKDWHTTPVGLIKNYWKRKQSILGRDFYITKSGEKLSTTYEVVPEDPSDFEYSPDYNFSEGPVIERLQEVMKRTLVMAKDPDLAEMLGYTEKDKLSSFLQSLAGSNAFLSMFTAPDTSRASPKKGNSNLFADE